MSRFYGVVERSLQRLRRINTDRQLTEEDAAERRADKFITRRS